jgi:phenylalanyl-tRNA synthetase beta chain
VKVLLSWLDELADLGDNADVVAEAMNELGLPVDDLTVVGEPIPGIITAEVLETRAHPQAERVHEVFVDTGDGQPLHVWCGAFNMQAGDVVPLATIGTTMPSGQQIGRRKILGVASEGMLCSAAELGLGDDHSGILILPPGTEVGVSVEQALGASPDAVFDIDVTRNRPDAYGHLGVARDVAAHLQVPFHPPSPELVVDGPERSAPVDIVAPDRCGRFVAVVLSGIRVGPSAPWMAERLTRAGMRPISNVVDVSNFVMLELNEPNHAYDLDALGGGGFRIRRATDGETMVTLDGVERTFTSNDLLIADANDHPIGIAGVMGGAETEIGDGTTVVALEMAWFDPIGVAATAARLGLRSEASARFERGRDPYGIDRAVARFVELLRETCPDLVVHAGLVDARGDLPPEHRSVRVRPDRVRALLGADIPTQEMVERLAPIGFEAVPDQGGVLDVSLPSWRPDCELEVDVIEEIARHVGYERLGRTVPKSVVAGRLSPIQVRRRLLRQVLYGLGISEAMPNPFLAPGDLDRAGLDPNGLTISNPLVAEEGVLRTSLRPGLFKALAYNASHRYDDVALFEIGRTYAPAEGLLPYEREVLGVALAGRKGPAAVPVLQEVVAALGLGDRMALSAEGAGGAGAGTGALAGMHPGRSSVVTVDGQQAGVVGEVDPGVLEAYGIPGRVAWLELDLTLVLNLEPVIPQWQPVSRYPSSDIDLAFVVGEQVTADDLRAVIAGAAGPLLIDLDLFDVYRGPGIPAGQRSLAFRIRLQAADHTLTDAEVAAVRETIVAAATAKDATLRA